MMKFREAQTNVKSVNLRVKVSTALCPSRIETENGESSQHLGIDDRQVSYLYYRDFYVA